MLMHRQNEKIDCFVTVVTPENIAFEYALAGPFQRLPAFVFDVGVRAVLFFGLLMLGGAVFSFVPLGSTLINVAALLTFFGFSWFYGLILETVFNGRTFGKMVFRLRTISTDGRPINAGQAGIRNILRLADMNVLLSLQIFGEDAPAFYAIPTMLVGLTTMTMTRRMQRIGDLAAGTMVVSERRQSAPWHLHPEDLRAYGLAELIPPSFQPSSSLAKAIGLYMENRRRLSPLRRNEIARHVADPLIREFGMLADTSPDLLLCALYTLVFMSEQQRAEGRSRMRLGTAAQQPRLPGSQSRVAAGSGPSKLGRPLPSQSVPLAQDPSAQLLTESRSNTEASEPPQDDKQADGPDALTPDQPATAQKEPEKNGQSGCNTQPPTA